MKVIKTYKVKLYPNKIQSQKLSMICGATRFVWNYYLAKRESAYQESKTNLSFPEQCRDLTTLRKTDGFTWLGDAPIAGLQQSLRRLDLAYRRYFRKELNKPSFKSKKHSRNSFSLAGKWSLRKNKIQLCRVGEVKFRGNFPVGVLKSITITQDKDGKWYASIVSHQEVTPTEKTGDALGIDLGLAHLAITSNGDKYETYRPKKIFQKRMKKLQQDLSRKEKGSNNRSMAKQKLAVLHKKISNQRMNYLHQTSHRITSENQAVIVCEDLAVKNMVKNHKLADAIHESGWAEFVRQLEYKQTWRGGKFVKIDRFFPSSKTCSSCGFISSKLPLSIRQWVCPQCSTEHDRDINAAKMILAQGLSNSLSVESAKSIPLVG